jgi:hypothetical protein
MGRVLLIGRLARRDLRRRPLEAGLLLLVIMVAATTLTVGLLLHGVTTSPYARTRAATAGPDVVASVSPPPFNGGRPANLSGLDALTRAPGVTGESGPYPVIETALAAHGDSASVQVEGRDRGHASLDQPALTQGTWIRPGGVVVERSFAEAFHLRDGDPVTIGGHRFRVVGVAVTAAWTPYPSLFCLTPCGIQALGAAQGPLIATREPDAGLIWLTRADLRSLGAQTVSYTVNLKLADPAAARAFVLRHNNEGANAPTLEAWQDISQEDGVVVTDEQRVLLTGSVLLSLLALASIAVLVGGRMADQLRRRIAVRRTRRLVLSVVSVGITVTGIVAVLAAHAQLTAQQVPGAAGLADPRTAQLNHVLLLITVMLVALAAVNAIFITWATVLDTRHASALARALGATPGQVTAGLAASQVLPALVGGIIGVPAGIALFTAVNPSRTTLSPQFWMLAVAAGAPVIVAALTVLPARIGANRPVAAILQSELA